MTTLTTAASFTRRISSVADTEEGSSGFRDGHRGDLGGGQPSTEEVDRMRV